ncbi:phosphotransferase family protein [Nocardia sp. NPDC058058]|uniref:phosphotransferase family protein n=1 Tax=Nocardia sp. NPDC058058 TaxID=3346317 RepID=UPI0036D88F5F
MSADDPNQRWELTVSDRDDAQLAEQLAAWLATKVEADDAPRVTSLTKPQAGGMSSTTLLFDAEWTENGAPAGGSYVARMPPEASSFPVFEKYDLQAQYDIMAAVAEATDIPVPPLCWMENDASILGSPFLVMKRVSGRVAEDNPPYVFFGWVFDSTPEERLEITRKTVDVIARVHNIDKPEERFPMLHGEGSALRRHFDAQKRWYDWALANDGFRIPLLERTFEYLEANWPDDSAPDVLSWGDARPGNIMFFEDSGDTSAVLDWEMAAIGPRELDVAWPILIHRFFQDIATTFDQPGLPDFLRRSDIEKLYEEATGHAVRDLDWYLTYAALRHGIVMARIKRRMIHFGEDTDTADRDDYVMHRKLLEALLDGTYAWD